MKEASQSGERDIKKQALVREILPSVNIWQKLDDLYIFLFWALLL